MLRFQITSVPRPEKTAGPPGAAIHLLIRAQTMGYLPPEAEGAVPLTYELIERVLERVEAAGIASRPIGDVRRGGKRFEQALDRIVEAIDASPNPAGEWEPAREVLGDELLGRLLHISESSIRRYAAGERETPNEVAWKLHAIAKVLAFTLGSYNDRGIQMWFDRPRYQLAEKTPADYFAAATSERDLEPVIELAETLIG